MAFDTYLQINGVDGESTDDKHQKWIEVWSFSHGVAQQGSGAISGGSSRVAGKVDVQEFTITKRLDKSSTNLNKLCCNGKHVDKAVLEVCKNTGKKELFMKYTFEHVVISSVNIGGGQGQEFPVETVSFNFGKITWEYSPTDPKTGAVQKGTPVSHDLLANKTA